MTQPRPSAAPDRRNPLVYVGAVVALAVIVATLGGLWYLFLRPAGPASVADATLPPVPTTSSGATIKPLGSGGVDGTWNVDTTIGSFSDFSDSFVGYRVQEQLAGIGANTAVGRTPNVSGTLTIAGTKVSAVSITADLTTLQSDDPQRDGQLQDHAIETSRFPTATFALTTPIDLGAVPTDGTEFSVTASGTLTLHGVTKDVQIALKAKLSGSVVVVTGSLPITFADYGIEKPTSFHVLSVDDSGTMEFQLFFVHA